MVFEYGTKVYELMSCVSDLKCSVLFLSLFVTEPYIMNWPCNDFSLLSTTTKQGFKSTIIPPPYKFVPNNKFPMYEAAFCFVDSVVTIT